jgi:uncharacterized protein YbaR (Trm112 family)
MSDPETGKSPDPAKPGYDRRMLEALICPVTQGPLSFDAEKMRLNSSMASLAYPIRNGIPIMLVSEAEALD